MRSLARWTTRCVRRYRFDRNPCVGALTGSRPWSCSSPCWPCWPGCGPPSWPPAPSTTGGSWPSTSSPASAARSRPSCWRTRPARARCPRRGPSSASRRRRGGTCPTAGLRTAVVTVPAHAKAGSSLEMWIDSSGRPTAPPRTHSQTVADTVVAGFGVETGVAGLLFLNLAMVRWLLDRRRYVDWDRAWISAHDRWRRPRQP